MRLKLTHNLTKKEWSLTISESKSSPRYFDLTLSLPEGMADGEYDYDLLDENDVKMASGMLQIGDFIPENTTYNNKKETYITYGE